MDNESNKFGATLTPPSNAQEPEQDVILSKVGVTVQHIHVDGLQRTKNDIVIHHVKPLFEAKNFEQMIKLAHTAKENLELLGLFKSCGIHIDIDKGANAKPDGYDVTCAGKEYRRFTGGISTLVGTNEGSLLFNLRMPNVAGRGERISSDFTYGSKNAVGWSLSFFKPLFFSPHHNFQLGVFQNTGDFPWSNYKEVDRGVGCDFNFSSKQGYNNSFRWEGVWRELSCLSRSTAFSVREQSGHSLKSALKHTWTRDTRDSSVLPNTGNLIRISNELAGIGGDVNYWKYETELQTNRKFIWDSVIQLSVSGGLMSPLRSDTKLNIMDKFFLGGPLTFRGFQIKGVGPHEDGCALGGDAYLCSGLHLYTPLPFRPGRGGFGDYFRTHFFAQAGTVTNSGTWQDFMVNSSALATGVRLSYGAGVVLKLGGIARLELNYSVPVRAMPCDRLNAGLQFGVGVTFI